MTGSALSTVNQLASVLPMADGHGWWATLNHTITDHSGAWWVTPIIMLFTYIDGAFPFLPSETLIVALSAIARTSGEPNLLLLGAGAAVAAFLGDNTAYAIGRRSGLAKLQHSRRARMRRAFAWASREIEHRGPVIILMARYIPIGRVAVNLMAGATGYDRRKFVPLTAIAGLTWGAYSVGIGWIAGQWIENQPIAGAGIGIVLAVILGIAMDQVMRIFVGAPETTPDPQDPDQEQPDRPQAEQHESSPQVSVDGTCDTDGSDGAGPVDSEPLISPR